MTDIITDDFEQDYEPVYNPYYLLDDGRIYDKNKKVFVTAETDADFKAFKDAGNSPLSIGPNGYTLEQLKRSVIKFYGWEMGDCLLSLEELKAKKLSELKTASDAFEVNLNSDMIIQSSIGYPMNADRRSQQNIQGMIAMADAQVAAGAVVQSEDGTVTVPYRCGDNTTRNLTIDQLKTVLMEALANGQHLYSQKWQYEQAINSAQTAEEVEAIEIKFEMMDFTA